MSQGGNKGYKPQFCGIDEEFTVEISLENCGTQIPEEITFQIISILPDIIVTEDFVAYFPKFVYQSSERQLRYHIRQGRVPNENSGV